MWCTKVVLTGRVAGVVLKGSFHAVEWANQTGRGGRCLAGIGAQVDAAVDGVVVLVGGLRGASPEAPSRGGLALLHVRIVDEGDVMDVVVDQELGRRHEVMDGGLRVRLLQPFVEGATERFHYADLQGGPRGRRERMRAGSWLKRQLPSHRCGGC